MPNAPHIAPETTKQHALRIRLDYHKSRDKVYWAKRGLALVALFVGCAYLAWMLVGGERAATHYSHGPVAAVHATWDGKCSACHTDFVPLRNDADGVRAFASLVGLAARPPADDLHRSTDAKCIACHAGPPHHSNMIQAEVASCAECHTDHRGRLANIARPDDRVCTACHADIGAHRLQNASVFEKPIENVSRFRTQEASPRAFHPPFRSLPKTDENQFKFNHQLHMLPGQFPADAKDEARWTLDKIKDEKLRERYRPLANAAGVVQLECASCHELDQAASHADKPAAPQAGQYMLPINYERHCQACHELDVSPTPSAPPGETAGLQIRHGLRQAEIKDYLYGYLAARQQEQPDALKPRLSPNNPIPGKSPTNNLAQNLPDSLKAKADDWQRALFNERCLYCHGDDPAPKSAQQWAAPADFPLPHIPAVWLAHARFNHSAHRAMDCKECHAAAYASPASGRPPLDDQHVMVPDIDNCVKCHAPGNALIGFGGGARYDCMECHRYHGAEANLHGTAAPKAASATSTAAPSSAAGAP